MLLAAGALAALLVLSGVAATVSASGPLTSGGAARSPAYPRATPPPLVAGPTTTTARPTSTRPGTTGPPATRRSRSDILVPGSGALFGSSAAPRGGQDRAEAMADLEAKVGRRFDVAHNYHAWDHPFPTSYERRWAAGGRILLLNWKPRRNDGSVVPWARIAAGDEDAHIATVAARVRSLAPHKVMLAFHHEPENELGSAFGSATDYARAFRHVHDVFAAEGTRNVVWVWNMIGYVRGFGSATYRALYPGDAYVDWVSYDPYNWWGCKPGATWRSFEEITKPFYDWTARELPGKPLMLSEFGTPEGPGSKATWFHDALHALKTTRSRIRAAVYWHNGPPSFHCDFRADTSPSALEAFTKLATDPHLH